MGGWVEEGRLEDEQEYEPFEDGEEEEGRKITYESLGKLG